MKTSPVAAFANNLLRDTIATSWALLKITIPVVIVTKILEEFGVIAILSRGLEPAMNIIGLPGAMGLVWATALMTNLYGAMVVFASLATDLHLSVAQVTVICSAMLIAHSLPLELAITQKAGAPFIPIALLRVVGAIIYCFLLNTLCRVMGVWQGPATIIFKAEAKVQTWAVWAVSQLENFSLIIIIIFCILVIMRILKAAGVITFLERMLEPVLPFFGMSKKAAPVTVVGMMLGISYGGALIIQETNNGTMARREVFFSLALMGLSHSLIEDTLLMVALGGHWGGILVGRVIFSLIVIYLLVHLLKGNKRV